jgi:hypothetical protein
VVNKATPTGDGWFYDDFSDAVKTTCNKTTPQRVSFSDSAKPPTGVTVKLECLNETQVVVSIPKKPVVTNNVAPTPTIGTSCELGAGIDPSQKAALADAKCAVQFLDGTQDNSMFCYLATNTCVKQCTSETDCPPAWVCDTRGTTIEATKSDTHPMGSAICVNPTCGTD